MKVLGKSVKLLLVSVIVFLGCFVNASWQDSCNFSDGCNIISENYSVPYCINATTNTVNSCVWPALTNQLSSNYLSSFSKSEVIEQFCRALYGTSGNGRIYFAKPGEMGNRDWQQTFDSRQSLFLYALCSSFTKGRERPFINENALVKNALAGDLVKILNLEQRINGKDACSLDENQFSKCDISIYATKIFTALMSDLYKIKYAQVLHIDTTASVGNDSIKNFMLGYSLIDKDNSVDLNAFFPKTISILKSDQEHYKNVLNSVKIIDNSLLSQRAKTSGCPVTGNVSGIDFVACALHSSQGNGLASTPSFLTLVYNEILHYRLFILYYNEWLKNSNKQNDSEGLDLDWYSSKQIEATNLVQHDFQDFSMTYPLHISILMYIERAEIFRNTNFSKIITSFYSLSEKLQNVQEQPS